VSKRIFYIVITLFSFCFIPKITAATFSDSWTIDSQADWANTAAQMTFIDTIVNSGSIQIDYNNTNLLNYDFEQPYILGQEPTSWTNVGNRPFVLTSSPVYHGNYSITADTIGMNQTLSTTRMKVSILDDFNNTLSSSLFSLGAWSTWQPNTVSLSTWKGQTIKIKFETANWDGSLFTNYGSLVSLPLLCSGGNFVFYWRAVCYSPYSGAYYNRFTIDFSTGAKAEYYPYTTASYISPAHDTGYVSPRWKLFYADYTSMGQTVNFSARTADDTAGIINASWYSITNNSDMANLPRKRVIQWKIEALTSDVSNSPRIDSVNVQWWTNSEPVLSWANTSNYWNCGASPIAGKPGDVFVYKVDYTDIDNDPPKTGYPKLHIKRNGLEVSGSPATMLEDNVSDLTYSDSKLYTYTIQLQNEGDYTYYFEAYDTWTYQGSTYNTLATGDPTIEKTDPQIKRYAPTLAWHNSFKNHRDKGIGQLSIMPGVNTHFEVDYYDPEDYPPDYIEVHILNNGVEIAGSPFAMLDGGWLTNIQDYKYGHNYYCNHVLSTESNSYTYYFEAKNTWGDMASGEPTAEHRGPDVSSSSPYLDHTGEAGYTNDMHEPGNNGANDTGTSNITTFNFRVKYTDAGNYEPASGWPKLYLYKVVDVDTGTKAELYATYVMDKDNPADIVYTDGCIYKYSTTLPGGKWSYRIMAYNTQNWGARGNGGLGNGECPYNVNDQTAYIFVSVAPQITLDQVSPTWGDLATSYIFTMKYTDDDSDSPMAGYYSGSIWYTDRYPKLHILKSGSEIAGSPFTMNAVNSDTDYYNGKNYTYTKSFLTGGDYVYYFEVKDKYGWHTQTNTQAFQVSADNPVITWCTDSGFVYGRNPVAGDTDTSFTWGILYQDADNDPPKTGYPKLHIKRNGLEIDSSAMTAEVGGSYSGGKRFSYSRTLPTNNANYSYWVEVYDQQNWAGIGEAGNTITAKFVSQKPEIPRDITEYPGPITTSSLTLKWAAADPDGDTLTYNLYFGPDVANLSLIYTGTKNEYAVENLKEGTKYYWKVEVIDPSGQKTTMSIASFTTASNNIKLLSWPNPFNPNIGQKINIVFNTNEGGTAQIIMFSEFGEKLWEKEVSVPAGTNSVIWDGRDSWNNIIPNGTYVCTVIKPDKTVEKHIVLVLKK